MLKENNTIIEKQRKNDLRFFTRFENVHFWPTLAHCSSYSNWATEIDFWYVVEECTLSKMSYSTAPNSTWVQNGDRFPTELSSSLFLVFWEVPRAPKGAD